jgi:hypothetical protein
VLLAWGLPDLVDTAQLITSELVTNAIKAAADVPPSDDEIMMYGSFAGSLRHIWIGLYKVCDFICIEVWDANRQPPKLKAPDLEEEGGRGIQLVAVLADRWGYRWPATGGKVVWARLAQDAA